MSKQKSPNITSTITPAYRRHNRCERHWLKKIPLRRRGKQIRKMQRQILSMNPEIPPICVFGSYKQDRAYRNIYRVILPPIVELPWPDVLSIYVKPMRRPDQFSWNDRSDVKKQKRRAKRRKINEFMRSLSNVHHMLDSICDPDSYDGCYEERIGMAYYHNQELSEYYDEIEPAYMHIKDMYEW